VLASVLFCQWLVRWFKPEPVITINFYSDEENFPTIELPRERFALCCS